MNPKTIDKAYELKESLQNDPRILLLNEKEDAMSNDEEAMKLCYKKDIANDEYVEMLRLFPEDSQEVKKAREKFYFTKKEFESLQVVKDYLKAYQDIRLLYEEINEILFKDFNKDLCPSKR